MNPQSYPDTGLTNTKIISENLSDRINEIKKEAGKDILLFGNRQQHIHLCN